MENQEKELDTLLNLKNSALILETQQFSESLTKNNEFRNLWTQLYEGVREKLGQNYKDRFPYKKKEG